MVQSEFSISWDSYKSNLSSGFSILQQNEELVDMTLAADGHLVKVHQVLIALASPYLKDMILSAPCQHPVIFLNNVSHKVLCLILEYIYNGEVQIPSELLPAFIDTATTLHIKGIDKLNKNEPLKTSLKHHGDELICELPGRSEKKVKGSEEIIQPMRSLADLSTMDSFDYSDSMDITDTHNSNDDDHYRPLPQNKNDVTEELNKLTKNLEYSVSIRGSLQLILNRFIYNLNTTKRGNIRRWRCVNYRDSKCTAYVITKGNLVINRANPHNHTFHDKKILAKISNKAIFSALDDAVSSLNKDQSAEDQTII